MYDLAYLANRFVLVLGLVCATALVTVAAQSVGAQADEFQIVSGDGYEGAIVPASSPYHVMFNIVFSANRGPTLVPPGLTPWTPTSADIAATERYFADFVTRAAKDPSRALAMLPAEDRPAIISHDSLQWLAANMRTLKRQYWGFSSDGIRRIAVHGAPDDPAHTWRGEGPVGMMGGGCSNLWLDFDLTEARIVRFTCGSDE